MTDRPDRIAAMIARCFAIGLAAALTIASPAVRAQDQALAQARTFKQLTDAQIGWRVQAVLDRYRDRPELVGLSVGVARDERVIVERGVGMADLEWRTPANADTIFRIGSLTKQFTAAAIMKLVEQGKVGLDDRIGDKLADLPVAWQPVTVRQLLNHSAGIPNYTAQPGFWAKQAPLDLTDAEVLKLVADKPLDFEPGSSWRYSNTHYYLLGMIVAKASGRAYGDYLAESFFKPLGLTHSRYGATRDIIAHRAHGYSFDDATGQLANAPAISMTSPGGAGGLVSTAGDLLRWQIALGSGRAVSQASFDRMIGDTVPMNQGEMRYGFGLMVDRFEGQRRIAHDGAIFGFDSVLIWLPDIGLRIAVLSNSEGMPSTAVMSDIIATLTSDAPLPPLRATPQPGAEAALRKLIEDQSRGTPDYAMIAPAFAPIVRAQAEQVRKILAQLGAIRSIAFRRVNLAGMDLYRVEFQNGAILSSVALTPDGKIAAMGFRPAPPAAPN